LSGRELTKHIKILDEFRKIDPWIAGQTIYAFLLIAQEVFVMGKTMRVMDIGALMDTTSASASRNLRYLVDHNLISLYENPDRRIEKFIEVTKTGRALARRIRL
jgi:DNA-binding MarR family transcriptional regulator